MSNNQVEKVKAKIANIEITDKNEFYKNAEEYWQTQPATVNGMLGGFEVLSKADSEYSLKLIEKYQKSQFLKG